MIIEGAIGDAYGAGFEFADRDHITIHNQVEQYIAHPNAPDRFQKYTDDTQMAIGIAELLIEGGIGLHSISQRSFLKFLTGIKERATRNDFTNSWVK